MRLTGRIIFAFTLGCLLFLVLPARGGSAQSGDNGSRTLSRVVKDKSGREVILYQSSHALVIGASRYTQGWPVLESVPSEVEEIAKALQENGFEVVLVMDPDSDRLEEAFEDFIDRYGYDENNRLLFFFSGHGYSMQNGEKGYLVPVDAPDPRDDQLGFLRKSLDMTQILAWSRKMLAKHALFLFDSCFSGAIFKTRDLPEIPPYISDITSKPVRQFITAGSAGQSVPARSVFAPTFVRALRGEGDLDHDGYMTGTELGLHLRNKVLDYGAHQTPQYGKIRDPSLDEGDFVFLVRPVFGQCDKIEEIEAARKQKTMDRQTAEDKKNALEKKMAQLKEETEPLLKEKETVTRRISLLESHDMELTARLSRTEALLLEAEDSLKNIEDNSKTKIHLLQSKIELMQKALDETNLQLQKLEEQKARLIIDRDESRTRLASLENELTKTKDRRLSLGAAAEQLKLEKMATVEELSEKKKNLPQVLAAARTAEDRLTAGLPELESALEAARRDWQQTTADLQALDQEIEVVRQQCPGRLFIQVDPRSSRIRFKLLHIEYKPGLSMAPGEYSIEISKTGYQTLVDQVTVRPAVDNTFSFTLPPLPAKLFVETKPASARIIFLTGKAMYRRGMELDPGEYKIRVEYDGYKDKEFSFSLEPGEEKFLFTELEQVQGRLFIETDPPGGTIGIERADTGFVNGMSLRAGSYRIEAQMPWRETKGQWVEVEPGKDNRYVIKLDPVREYTNSLGMKFRLIQVGSFTMGYPRYKSDHRQHDQDPHPAYIRKPYYLQVTEVTQGQYKKVTNTNPSTHANCGSDCPVDSVTWYDAQDFVVRLNQMEGTVKYRLPTEEEWEYACLAGSDSAYCFGDSPGQLGDYAWYNNNSGLRPHGVGQKSPNAWGLYDLHGSVFEWCQNQVGRGGSWKHFGSLTRCTLRVPAYKNLQYLKEEDLGFRVVRDP